MLLMGYKNKRPINSNLQTTKTLTFELSKPSTIFIHINDTQQNSRLKEEEKANHNIADNCDLCMENSKGSFTMRNVYNKKHYSLPPKSPNPSIAPFYSNYGSDTLNGSKGMIRKHQRTSSEILMMEEQPSWLDDLLDEPETPVKTTHKRSSSMYIESANANTEHAANVLRNMHPASSWASQQKQVCVSPQTASRCTLVQEVSRTKSATNERQNTVDCCTEEKCFKQQFGQHSRVRKLQYIAELERNVQALEAEGCEVSGELKFLNQKSLILTMENKALKQRLENLAQEQLIKYLEHEVLERELRRLTTLYKQQKQPLVGRI
ncbi:hypothetical protein QVD17_26804 [Tagetes erecta]|uniref:BZIP domain-containing protein n=1 Tax=Tagetes erecta TaxID=13708 RepID=A0AAD8KAR7_TARER|nr:hypothetical protein QVD17_26804 [Tagetes erecta]